MLLLHDSTAAVDSAAVDSAAAYCSDRRRSNTVSEKVAAAAKTEYAEMVRPLHY